MSQELEESLSVLHFGVAEVRMICRLAGLATGINSFECFDNDAYEVIGNPVFEHVKIEQCGDAAAHSFIQSSF